jgi:hypothetical protein
MLQSRAMKPMLIFVLVSCILSGLPAHPSTPRVSEGVKTVKQVMAELTAAELRYDPKAVDRLLDEDFIYVGNDGSLTSRIDFISLTDQVRNPLNLLEITTSTFVPPATLPLRLDSSTRRD